METYEYELVILIDIQRSNFSKSGRRVRRTQFLSSGYVVSDKAETSIIQQLTGSMIKKING